VVRFKSLLLITLIWVDINVFAQNDLLQLGAENLSMGNSYLFQENAFSGKRNPYTIPYLKRKQIGISVQNNYLLKELSSGLISLAVPIKQFGFGLHFQHFGSNNYNIQTIGMSSAIQINKQFSFGIGADYESLNVSNYGRNNLIKIHGGMMINLSKSLKMALHVYNPLNNYNQQLVTSFNNEEYSFGIQYKPNDVFNLNIESYMFQNIIDVKFGANYIYKKQFFFRVGVSVYNPMFSFGIGFKFKERSNIDLASSVHPRLGVVNNFTYSYEMGKEL